MRPIHTGTITSVAPLRVKGSTCTITASMAAGRENPPVGTTVHFIQRDDGSFEIIGHVETGRPAVRT